MDMKLKHVFVLLFSCMIMSAKAQLDVDTSLPYIKHPEMPAFRIQLLDSVKFLNTFNIKAGKATMLMLFSPDCEHCQHMADSMKNHMTELKDVQIYMFSFMELRDIKKFAEKYTLNKHKNIVFGKDIDFFFAGFYQLKAVPGIAVYDKNKKFVKLFNGSAKIQDIISTMQQL